MKHLAALCVVVLAGCDWDAAEKQARCAGGDSSACPDGGLIDVGTTDAGTSDGGGTDAGSADAGTVDAGTPDAGIPDAGPVYTGVVNPVALSRDLVGLFPRGDAGALWLVTRSPGRAFRLDPNGNSEPAGTVMLTDEVIDAYADGVAQPLLGVLVNGGANVALYDESDGGLSLPVPEVPGRWVTTFFNGTSAFASVWNNRNNNYVQTIVGPTSQMSFSTVAGCSYELADLQVMRADEGARVLFAFQSGPTCTGVPPLPPDAGIAFITNTGASGIVASGLVHRLGRLEGDTQRGFVAATALDGGRAVRLESFIWQLADGGYSPARSSYEVAADAGLTLGDVSGNVVSGVAYGQLTGPFGAPAGFVAGTPTAFVASNDWAVALGATVPNSHVPVLRVGARVFVAWREPSGGFFTAVLNAGDGGR